MSLIAKRIFLRVASVQSSGYLLISVKTAVPNLTDADATELDDAAWIETASAVARLMSRTPSEGQTACRLAGGVESVCFATNGASSGRRVLSIEVTKTASASLQATSANDERDRDSGECLTG